MTALLTQVSEMQISLCGDLRIRGSHVPLQQKPFIAMCVSSLYEMLT